MKTKYIIFGLIFIGILLFGANFSYGFEEGGVEGGDEGESEETPDEDKDGINDELEDINKRDILVWIGENVIEVASIRRSEVKKDVIDLRVGYSEDGLSIRVSYGTYVKCETEQVEESPEKNLETQGESCEYTVDYKLRFEVFFRGLIEFVDLDENGVIDEETDEWIKDYRLNSFQPIEYSLHSISNDTNLHYILLNTTTGVFTAHIYLVEEFTYVNDVLISPTQAKIDIEITNYDYTQETSQLALLTKLWSEEVYREKEETVDEKEGYSTGEKEVSVESNQYSGFFSWKETAFVDGIEMEVKTKELYYDGENSQKLFICYPRGTHIYHDPKIGIFIGQLIVSDLPVIITWSAICVIGIASVIGFVIKKRRIR